MCRSLDLLTVDLYVVDLSIYRSSDLSICRSTYRSVDLLTCRSVDQFICRFVELSICRPIDLYSYRSLLMIDTRLHFLCSRRGSRSRSLLPNFLMLHVAENGERRVRGGFSAWVGYCDLDTTLSTWHPLRF